MKYRAGRYLTLLNGSLITGLKCVFPFHYAAWRTAYVAIDKMVNEATVEKQNRSIEQWQGAVLSQLASVGLIGAIMAAVIVGSFSWPTLVDTFANSNTAWAMLRILWYTSLILAIAAVSVGLQQSVFLARLSCTSNANGIIRDLLSHRELSGRRKPRKEQVILWQLANGLLETSLYLWLGGFVVFVWKSLGCEQTINQGLIQ